MDIFAHMELVELLGELRSIALVTHDPVTGRAAEGLFVRCVEWDQYWEHRPLPSALLLETQQFVREKAPPPLARLTEEEKEEG